MHVFDFETEAIVGNVSVRPPKPVGLAYKRPGYKGRYVAWGHPDGNHTDGYAIAQKWLEEAIASGEPFLFHNAKFDISVAEAHMGVSFANVPPTHIHDTLYSIFLHDPYASTFSLKPSAERILGLPPSEQDALRDWILSHAPQATEKTAGAYIALAPASIVGPYAIGDVDRTLKLHEFLINKIPLGAYQREQRLMPILRESEKHGIRCDVTKLNADTAAYEAALERCNDSLCAQIGACNLDSGEELANSLEAAGKISQWILTPTGRRSVSRANLEAAISDIPFLRLLQYRGALSYALSSFLRPWCELSGDYGGRLHPEWNQVRQDSAMAKTLKGTRTGRLSGSRPSFMNVSNEYDIVIPDSYPAMPLMKEYLLPDKGMRWLKRDYSQQELRILAHFSEGRLYERYQENPRLDAHEETSALITEHTGLTLPRKPVKIIGFSVIYGAGLAKLAESLSIPYGEAQTLRNAYYKALPEVPLLMRECSNRGKSGSVIETWGGRQYPVEPPRLVNGRMMEFSYKLLNYLIQGSAADCTKEAILRWDADKGTGQFLATVHDEINIQSPVGKSIKDMAKLRDSMESIEFDVQMLSDGFVGNSWAKLETCE